MQFFQVIFTKYKEDKLQFRDGRNEITFSTPPKVMDLNTYDNKYYPCILVGIGPSNLKDVHFNKFRGIDNTTSTPENIYGGSATATVTFLIYAANERDLFNLTDVVCMYLAKHDSKKAFENNYGLRILTPSCSGEGVEDDPQTNVKRFYSTVTLNLECDFEDNVDIYDQFGNIGLTVLDIFSYIADSNGDGEITDFQDNTVPS